MYAIADMRYRHSCPRAYMHRSQYDYYYDYYYYYYYYYYHYYY